MRTSYGLEDRYKAAAAYVATGSYVNASRQTKIPESTIRSWAQHDEFQAMCREMRAEFGDEIKVGMANIVRDGVEQIRDRVINGDYVQDKDGNLKRKPVNVRDLTIATGTMFDKLRISEGLPTQIVRQESQTETYAKKLLHLQQFAGAKNEDERKALKAKGEDAVWAEASESRRESIKSGVERLARLADPGVTG